MDLLLVLFQCTGIYQDIINIANTEDVEVFIESIIHELLGSSRGISKPEVHNKEFKQPILGSEDSFPFVTLLDTDLIETSLKVKMGKVFAGLNLIQGFFN